MDTPTWTQPPAPAPFTPQPHRSRKLLMTALVLGLIASLISAYFIWRDWSSTGLPLLSGSQDVLLEPQTLPLFPAAVLNTGSLKLTPLTVEGQGTGSLLSYAHGKDKNYYLLTTDGKTSNVFVSDTKNLKAGLSQRTNSNSLKLSLSYDAQSDLLAFATISGSSSMITLVRSGTTTEQMLARGSNPVLLKGGYYILYEQAGTLRSLNTSDGSSREVLTIPLSGAYAVDPNGLQLALYNPKVNAVQYFSIKNMDSVSALSSAKSVFTAGTQALVFTNTRAIQVLRTDTGVAIPAQGKQNIAKPVPGSGAYASALITTYEN